MTSAVGVLFVSRLGPTNLPPLEALSLGTPVVVTHTNCNLLHDPKNGVWVVEDDSISSLIDAVDELIIGKNFIHFLCEFVNLSWASFDINFM